MLDRSLHVIRVPKLGTESHFYQYFPVPRNSVEPKLLHIHQEPPTGWRLKWSKVKPMGRRCSFRKIFQL